MTIFAIAKFLSLAAANVILVFCVSAGNGFAAAPAEDQESVLARKTEIMMEAQKDPSEALLNRKVYEVATPEEIRELIGEQKLGEREFSYTRAMRSGGESVSQIWGSLGEEPETVYRYESPLAVASYVTPYPEVIHLLVKAGCKATDVNSEPLRSSVQPQSRGARGGSPTLP
jgi:hypothetical protein